MYSDLVASGLLPTRMVCWGGLAEAAYLTGERYQYRYDAIGNRTQMRDLAVSASTPMSPAA